jgi:rubrerythrin
MATLQFNADEVFEIAEQIERNGVKFYTKAASYTPNEDGRKLFLDLADMEKNHEKIFAKMRSEYWKRGETINTFDPDNEAAAYLRSFADGYVFDLNADPSDLINERKSPEDIIKIAIGLEKDSITFYYGIKEVMISNPDKEKVEAIIKEEMSHITYLSKKLKEIT